MGHRQTLCSEQKEEKKGGKTNRHKFMEREGCVLKEARTYWVALLTII